MRYFKITDFCAQRFAFIFITVILLLALSHELSAQEPPPRPIVVTVTSQGLSFGAFTHGAAGGTVTISSGGLRSSTGDVVQLGLGFSYSTALYEVIANPGTVISLLNGPDVLLPGSNGGSLSLHIGDSDLGSPFVTTVA